MESRLERLAQLREEREKASALNLKETKQEAARKALNNKNRQKEERKLQTAQNLLEKKTKLEQGFDLEREKCLNMTAEEFQNAHKRKIKKMKKADTGFSDYAQMSFRKYKKKVKKLGSEMLNEVGSADRVAEDIKEDDKKRSGFSKVRRIDNSDDVTYINDRNLKFNQKLSRHYEKYTKDLVDNLERGTAL